MTTRTTLTLFLRCTLTAAFALVTPTARADVGDITLRTDHPDYPGEGAFQTVGECVEFATRGRTGEQERALALYQWILTHQWHLASPQEPRLAGLVPDAARSNQEDLIVYDANKGRFSYGYGLCGTVHAWNEPYWRALGMPARRRSFPGHTNSEIYYGGRWHAFDTDMAGLLFRRDGVVAGYDDLRADPTLADAVKPPWPGYPFAWPGDRDVMRQGWRQVATGGEWDALHNGGYAAQPGIVTLRSGESFRRTFDPDAFGGPARRRFWHHQAGGPYRDWTFANQGTPRHDGADSNSRGHARYCNGVFDYRPLSGREWRDSESLREATGVAALKLDSGQEALRGKAGEKSSITFRHFAPYVICGDPADDANPMTGPATDGLVVSGRRNGDVWAFLSVDHGQTWEPVGGLTGERFSVDLTDRVKGRYGWEMRFEWVGADLGLDDLRFVTTTQVSQAIYPRLKPGGSEVVCRSGASAVVPAVPNLGLNAEPLKATGLIAEHSSNLRYAPRAAGQRAAWTTTNNRPATVTFRVASPGELRQVSAAVRFAVRVPPPEGCDYHLDLSTDGGRSWREFARADVPADNRFSSGWMSGAAEIDAPDIREALVRATIYNGGYQCQLLEAEVYGVRRTPPPQEYRIEYEWRENGVEKKFAADVGAGTESATHVVPTGEKIEDRAVTIRVP